MAISGFSSNSGKTTLLCRLLERLAGWEAIKVTKGHYRSCGKDPHACCVSHLLSDAPLVRSGRGETFERHKDTGRYWDSGAANVHWVIATKEAVGHGVTEALGRVAATAPGVLVEGTGFVKTTLVDYMVMVASPTQRELKPSAASVLDRSDALYILGASRPEQMIVDGLDRLRRDRRVEAPLPEIYWDGELDRLLTTIESRVA